LNRFLTVFSAVIASIAAGWLGYKLSGAAPVTPAATTQTSSSRPVVESTTIANNSALMRLMSTNYSDLQGRPLSLRQWSGKVLVVNFWATWCPPCREEMPGFSRLQKKYAVNGVQFVGIGIDDADKIQQYQKDFPVDYPLAVAELDAMSLTAELGNSTEGLPFTVFIDRAGRLHSAKVGRMSEPEVELQLRELL
jgi:thiol-disulfide isomerase/thioredoxin